MMAFLKRHKRAVFSVYIIALLLSFGARHFFLGEIDPKESQQVGTVREVNSDGTYGKGSVDIAYYDVAPRGEGEVETIVLLHGTPVASVSLRDLRKILGERYRVIVPDLPGFGRSSSWIPDYSIQSHAIYLKQLLDSIGVSKVHLVGYSMGGGVGIEYVDDWPNEVSSLVLLSAIGVQEHELFGDYFLNHSVHGVQLCFMWVLQEMLPHFGLLDVFPLNKQYARNLFDSDQRPLRAALVRYEGPALIVHGVDDGLVPLRTAREHARILPQSELVLLEGGHGVAFKNPEKVVDPLGAFVLKVSRKEGVTRDMASEERRMEARRSMDQMERIRFQGFALLIAVLGLALATFVSEDLTCIAAGLLVSRGVIGFFPAMMACLVGIVVGDILLVLAGRLIRNGLLRLSWFPIKEEKLKRGEAWIKRRGALVAIISRFTPGTRLATYVAVGVLGASLKKFVLYFLLAAILWTPLLVGVAVLWGEVVGDLWGSYEEYAIVSLIVIAVLLLFLVRVIFPLFTHRGRRLLLSRYRRMTSWEFWPTWFLYPPIVIYIVGWLGIRYRSVSLLTLANPAIPDGGFLGESKSAILKGLEDSNDFVASWTLICGGVERRSSLETLKDFMKELGLSYPVVLKPDVGYKGMGVRIVQNEEEARSYIESMRGNIILQEYISGDEFGIFYCRRPSEEDGFIFSITEKRMLYLTGDGQRTLEQLILDDPRAVCMARFHLKKHYARLDDVLREGESYQLVEIGTHSRGSLFLDGSWVKTDQLEAQIDRIAKSYQGFFLGRFDIRVPSLKDFKEGKNFKIVELNGVTSEATHIYDPKNSVLYAYKTLCAQWRLTFEIADENRKLLKMKPMGIVALVKQVFAPKKNLG
jgi:pimeloyl-ACP methyl ester carboxylesterase/membrane protein DedA with SNARE-associated domain